MFSFAIVSLLFNLSTLSQILPLESEKLPSPIKLTFPCSTFEIQEWQNEPKNNSKEIEILNSVCHLVKKRIEFFYGRDKKKCSNLSSFQIKISLLNRGSNPRELNDNKFRFFSRRVENSTSFLGYFDFSTKHLFLFNEFQHSKFKTVWAHELFHAINYHCGFYVSMHKEEQEAQKFTNYLGLGE
jgi:hypothetical protein